MEEAEVTTGSQVLACTMNPRHNDAKATTIRAFLVRLAAEVWEKGDLFSGKRPFGYSGWHWDVYEALGRAGLIAMQLDGEDELVDCDEDAGDELIKKALEALAKGD